MKFVSIMETAERLYWCWDPDLPGCTMVHDEVLAARLRKPMLLQIEAVRSKDGPVPADKCRMHTVYLAS